MSYIGLLVEQDLEFERVPGTDKVLVHNAVEGRAICIRMRHLMRAHSRIGRVIKEFQRDNAEVGRAKLARIAAH